MWKGGKKQKPSGAQYRKKRRDLEIAVLRNSQTLPELFKARMQTDHEKVNELSKGVAQAQNTYKEQQNSKLMYIKYLIPY